jgi:hypothetical protein
MKVGIAAGLLGAASLLAACSNAAVSKAVGTANTGGAPIVITTSPSALIVENHAGRPLLDVRVTIDAGQTTPFVYVESTIDTNITREMALTNFRNEEGVILDPASVHPTRVTLTARDTLAKSYNVTAAWIP